MRIWFLFLLAAGPVLAADWSVISNATLSAHTKFDGDSIPVVVDDEQRVYNLYCIDAPETSARVGDKIVEQAAHWEQDKEDLAEYARKIGPAIKLLLESGPFEIHTREHAISKSEKRYYALVRVGERYLSEILVEAGLARPQGKTVTLPDGTTALDYMNRLRALEDEAREAGRGCWSELGGDVVLQAPERPPAPVAVAAPTTPGAPEAGGVLTLSKPLKVYRLDGKFREVGTLKAGRRIQLVDAEPLVRVLIEVPGKAPVEALVRKADLSFP